jgi:hypothetical protein
MGGVYFYSLYELFGLNPYPYHVVITLLLLVNVFWLIAVPGCSPVREPWVGCVLYWCRTTLAWPIWSTSQPLFST